MSERSVEKASKANKPSHGVQQEVKMLICINLLHTKEAHPS